MPHTQPVQDRLDALENDIEVLCDSIYVPHSRDCQRCPPGTTIVNLRQHAVEVHRSKDLKDAAKRYLHFCRFCDYVTEDVRWSESHGNTHENRKPYFCRACNKRFTGRCDLCIHVRSKHPGMQKPRAKEMRQMMDDYDAELRAKAERINPIPSGSSAPTSTAPSQLPPSSDPPQGGGFEPLSHDARQHGHSDQGPSAPPAYPSSYNASAAQQPYHDARAAWAANRAPMHPPPSYAPYDHDGHVQAADPPPSHVVRQSGYPSQAPPVYPSSRDASAPSALSHAAPRDRPPPPNYAVPPQTQWRMSGQVPSSQAVFGNHNGVPTMGAPPTHDAVPDSYAAWPELGFAPPVLDPAFHPVAAARADPQRERFNYPRPLERRGRPAQKARPSPVLSIASTSRRSSMARTHNRHGSGSASPWQSSSGGWPSTPVSSASSPYASAPSPLQPSTPSSYTEPSGWPVATPAQHARPSPQHSEETLSEGLTSEIVGQVSAQLLQHPDVLAELRRMAAAEMPASVPSESASMHSRSSSSGNPSVTRSLAPRDPPASPWNGSGDWEVDTPASSSNPSPYASTSSSRQASAQGSRPQSDGWLVDAPAQGDWASSDLPAAPGYDESYNHDLPPGFWNEDIETGFRQMAVAEGSGTGPSQCALEHSEGSFGQDGETGSSQGYAAQQDQAQNSTVPAMRADASEVLHERREPSPRSARPSTPESSQAVVPVQADRRRAVFAAAANNPFWHPWADDGMLDSTSNPGLLATESYTPSADFSTLSDMPVPEQNHFDITNYFASHEEVADMDRQIFPMDEELMVPVRDTIFPEYQDNWDST